MAALRAGAAAGDLDVRRDGRPAAYARRDAPAHRGRRGLRGRAVERASRRPYLAHRLDAAAELYRAGGQGRPRHRRQQPRGLRRAGRDAHVSDRARGARTGGSSATTPGFDTWDSCVRAKKIFGVDRAVLISQGFHIRRAVALCQAAGVESYGVGVDDRHDATWYYGGAREVFAAGKAALDAVFKPDPRFLGAEEPGVREALAASRAGDTRTSRLDVGMPGLARDSEPCGKRRGSACSAGDSEALGALHRARARRTGRSVGRPDAVHRVVRTRSRQPSHGGTAVGAGPGDRRSRHR